MDEHFNAAKQLLPFYGDVKLISVLRGNDVASSRKREREMKRADVIRSVERLD